MRNEHGCMCMSVTVGNVITIMTVLKVAKSVVITA